MGRRREKLEAAQAELISNARRSNEEIAAAVGCTINTVINARTELLAEGRIVSRRTGIRPMYDKVRAELLRNPDRTDRAIAFIVGCSTSKVWSVRHDLEERGEIPTRRTRHEQIIEALKTWKGSQAALARKLGIAPTGISAAVRRERELQRVRAIVEKQR